MPTEGGDEGEGGEEEWKWMGKLQIGLDKVSISCSPGAYLRPLPGPDGGQAMKKILVVDDEENIRFLYKEELEEEGFAIELAKNGEEALEKLRLFRPDLITLDIKMPGMDGLETLKRIRETERDLPIVLCSAYGEYKQDFTTWASDAYVVKSADLTELKATIQKFLERR
jgi:CheY-like chemotaxis protein